MAATGEELVSLGQLKILTEFLDTDGDGVIPFDSNGELEDLTIRTGSFTNAGAGWNTFTFPMPFDGVPMVLCSVEGYGIEIKTVTEKSFLYRVSGSAVSGSTSFDTKTFYTYSSASSSYPYVMNMSYSYYTTPVTVLTGSSSTEGDASPSVADPVEIKYFAIEYGGE